MQKVNEGDGLRAAFCRWSTKTSAIDPNGRSSGLHRSTSVVSPSTDWHEMYTTWEFATSGRTGSSGDARRVAGVGYRPSWRASRDTQPVWRGSARPDRRRPCDQMTRWTVAGWRPTETYRHHHRGPVDIVSLAETVCKTDQAPPMIYNNPVEWFIISGASGAQGQSRTMGSTGTR